MFNACAKSGADSKLSRNDLMEALKGPVSGDPQLVFLDKNDEQEMLHVFAESFLEDPLMKWIAGLDDAGLVDKEKKKELHYKLNRTVLGGVNRPILVSKKGIVLGAKTIDGKTLVGTMSLMPGQYNNDSFSDCFLNMIFLDTPPLYTKEEKNYGPMGDKRLDSISQFLNRRPDLMKNTYSNYVYIQMIGVLSSHQGKGLGGKLLRAILNAADSVNVSLYLETESKENESLYQHFGFYTAEVLELTADGTPTKQPMYLMIRRPN